jgi:hypothetical protein
MRHAHTKLESGGVDFELFGHGIAQVSQRNEVSVDVDRRRRGSRTVRRRRVRRAADGHQTDELLHNSRW